MPSSDTAPYAPGQGHPQVAGSFAGFFRLVREKGVMTLEEAVYRATLLPARPFGLPGKGSLEVGADADIAVFDFDSIEDCSRYPDEGAPDAPAKGVRHVLIGGEPAIEDGQPVNLTLGRSIRA